MTPTQGNVTLVFGVLVIGASVAFTPGVRSLPLLPRGLWAGAALCLSGLFVYYQLWIPRAETLDAKTMALAPVENTEYRELVGQVIHAFEPRAYISVAGAVLSPDGARTVDIQVWPINGGGGPTVIDVIDRPDGRPVGIDAIDMAESKRRDVRAKAMLLCSNTGFDTLAIQKAKRTNIGLISVLKQGDKRIKGKILEEIYLRKINLGLPMVEYEGATASDLDTLRQYVTGAHHVTYKGGSVAGWLQHRASMIVFDNPQVIWRPLIARFNLKEPTVFLVQGHQVTLRTLTIRFHPKVQWLSQLVALDAKNGIYDYLRGRVRLAGGPNSYVIEGVNFDTATPIPSPPPVSNVGVGLQPGEVDITLMMAEDIDLPKGRQIPRLEELVKPEDLSTTITGSPPEP
jgi:hypothetical protein